MTPESENPPQPESIQPAEAAAPKSSRKAAKAAPQPQTIQAADGDEPAALSADDVMPEASGRRDAAALALLFDACERFNVNPGMQVRPRELAAWRYYPGDVLEDVPPAVVIVTAGGVKLKYFEGDVVKDADTEERLRAVFRSFVTDPKTKERLPGPLPGDLSLPAEAVLGQPASTAHRHPLGYLRRGR